MKTLLVMTGAPGCGKTSAIAALGMSEHAVGLDSMRELMAPRCHDDEGHLSQSLTPRIHQTVERAYHEAVNLRMSMGEDLVLDNTSLRGVGTLIDHARSLGYRVLVLDAQGQATDEELVERQEQRRGHRTYVSPEAVVRYARRHRDNISSYAGSHEVLDASSPAALDKVLTRLEELNRIHAVDLDAMDRVAIIGDVQSCGRALARAVEVLGLDEPGTHTILAGDLYDRGTSPVEVYRTTRRLKRAHQRTLVTGNHDQHMLNCMRGNTPRSKLPRTWESIDALHEAGINDDAIAAHLDDMVEAFAFTRGGHQWLVTHGGLSAAMVERIMVEPGTYDLLGVTAHDLVYGSSPRETTYHGNSDYSLDACRRLTHPTVVQAHGHRNGGRNEEPMAFDEVAGSYNLESRVEGDGHLSVLMVQRDGTGVLRTFTED